MNSMNCLCCNKEFTPNKRQKYCSKKCRDKTLGRRYHENKARKQGLPFGKQSGQCQICGKIFEGRLRVKRYCSKACAHKAQRLNHNITIQKHELIQCLNCGKTFNQGPNNQKFCSPKCAHKFYYDTHCATIIKRNTQNIQTKMKLNPTFRKRHLETIRRASKNNERKYKEKLFTLLGNKCEVCGTDIFDVLTIHHNNPKTKPKVKSTIKWKSMYLQYFEGHPLRLLCFNHHALLHRNKLTGDIIQMTTKPKQQYNYRGKLLNEY
jgi:hypothetical protein